MRYILPVCVMILCFTPFTHASAVSRIKRCANNDVQCIISAIETCTQATGLMNFTHPLTVFGWSYGELYLDDLVQNHTIIGTDSSISFVSISPSKFNSDSCRVSASFKNKYWGVELTDEGRDMFNTLLRTYPFAKSRVEYAQDKHRKFSDYFTSKRVCSGEAKSVAAWISALQNTEELDSYEKILESAKKTYDLYRTLDCKDTFIKKRSNVITLNQLSTSTTPSVFVHKPGVYPVGYTQHIKQDGLSIFVTLNAIEITQEGGLVVELASVLKRIETGLHIPMSFDVPVPYVEQFSDYGNKSMYLVDDKGRRYEHVKTSGKAASTTVLFEGFPEDGFYYHFNPLPKDVSYITFVDEDNFLSYGPIATAPVSAKSLASSSDLFAVVQRDFQKMRDIEKIRQGLMYFPSYPIAKKTVLGAPATSCLNVGGFVSKAVCKKNSDSRSVLIEDVPKSPVASPYIYESTDGNSYSLYVHFEIDHPMFKKGQVVISPTTTLTFSNQNQLLHAYGLYTVN